jgi:uncharacterized protein
MYEISHIYTFSFFSMNNTLSAVVIGLALIIAAWIIGQNINHTATVNMGGQNALAVSGDGKVFAKPDTFLLTIMAEEKSKTTKDGFAKVNAKIGLLQKLMKDNNIAEKDIQSVNININPNYIYDNSKTSIDGFIATHGLAIKIRNLDSIDTILSGVSAVDGVRIQSTGYDIDEKTALYRDARDLAIAKAKQKAEDMAKASGITLGKVMSISESQNYTPIYANQFMMKSMDSVQTEGGGVSAGQLEISTTVNISYEIK